MVISLVGAWLIATDPQNVGREQKWWAAPVAEAKQTKVPWIIQDAFPGYHGVAWYWKEFEAPVNPHPNGRYLLRFWAVDYLAEVWLSGVKVGGHEGGETPFVLDVTEAIKPAGKNLVAVRVLNPTHEPIDGIVLNETPHRNKAVPYTSGSAWDQGGIIDAVELLTKPPVWIEDLFVRADPKTGTMRVQAKVRRTDGNTGTREHGKRERREQWRGRLDFSVAPAASGETLLTRRLERELPVGDTLVETELKLENPRLWELNDPFLYRVTARVAAGDAGETPALPGVAAEAAPTDERSVRCGFRDFRFENDAFRLNGRRIYLRCSHTGNACPIGLELPHDPDLLRRDLLNVKVMGFNAIRFISGIAKREQLDLCDEIGLMVYEESYAGWCLADSPKMAERFDRSTAEMVKRDRNHPSLVIWGMLNETDEGPVFRQAVKALSLVRSLDDSRLVMLNSGRWDQHAGGPPVGSLSNPGSDEWEDVLSDQHQYPRVPHTASTIHFLRTLNGGPNPVFLSEYGIGSAVDLVRLARHYEQLGAEYAEDAQFYRGCLNQFLADWERWKMAEAFGRPEDYFAEALAKMAEQRLLGLNAIRANPNIISHSLTGTVDQGMTGEGLTTTFREFKPGTMDAVFDGFAPLRWCLFVEPVNVPRGAKVRVEAVLANEDALKPGEYPARLQVFGPGQACVWAKTVTVTIPEGKGGAEPPFALPVLAEDVAMDGAAGEYRFVATFEHGAAAAGGQARFYVADPAQMPPVPTEVVLWGEEAELAKWLAEHNIHARPFAPGEQKAREVILVSRTPAASGGAEAFAELARHIARGSVAVFLCPEVFKKGDDPLGWLPLANKGTPTAIVSWVYLKDEWAKSHPIFDGLPLGVGRVGGGREQAPSYGGGGGLLDYTFYREIIPDAVWHGQDPPAEAVAGAIKASQAYSSGLLVAVHNLGAGRFILNTLLIRENLGTHPAAERLLRNMLRYAGRDIREPVAELPKDFDRQLAAIGYR
jgi:hypothetical protein